MDKKYFSYVPHKEEEYLVKLMGHIRSLESGGSVPRPEFMKEFTKFLKDKGWKFSGRSIQVDKKGNPAKDIDL
ncbi:hypothetical protein Q7A53_19780 [Halobacillus rhizosphaerae]|uniref:hypothetical protein n=1 Tax=Halobacillus rhizosphaerae TaxID=3064889 RepID=UPI00398A6228